MTAARCRQQEHLNSGHSRQELPPLDLVAGVRDVSRLADVTARGGKVHGETCLIATTAKQGCNMLRRMRNAVLRLASHGDALPNDCAVHDAPSEQNVINQFDNWISAAPPGAPFSTGGNSPLFSDGRVEWGIDVLGGVEGLDILELGPLEAGHTYMLHKAGARSVLGIEAMSQSYFKCLAIKEVL